MKRVRKSAMLVAAIGVAMLQGAYAEERNAEIFNGLCNRCHNYQGEGNKSLEAPLIAGMPAWYIEKQLQNFRLPEGARGQNPQDMAGMRMRPMARTLYTEADIKGISAYVEALPIQTAAPTLEGANIEQGKAGFAMCMGCHGMDAKGMQAIGAPKLAGQSDWYLLTQLKNFKAGIRNGPMMQPIASGLDESAMRNIAAYLGSLSGK